MPSVAGRFQGVVQVGEKLGGFEVGRVFGIAAHGFLAAHEGELADVAVQVAQSELGEAERTPVVEERQVFLVLRLKIVERQAGEVAENHVARHLVVPSLPREVVQVGERL